MIVGTGVDLAEVPRIKASIERFGARFTGRIYTAAEIAYVERKANRFERYAARFAAKEAGMKAIGTGWRHGVRWQEVELPAREPSKITGTAIPAKAACAGSNGPGANGIIREERCGAAFRRLQAAG